MSGGGAAPSLYRWVREGEVLGRGSGGGGGDEGAEEFTADLFWTWTKAYFLKPGRKFIRFAELLS